MSRGAILLGLALAFASLAIMPIAPRAAAADVNVNLYGTNFVWHVGTSTSTSTTITATVGDTLRVRIENQDTEFHTFTVPALPAVTGQGGGGNFLNLTISAGAVVFWNYTVTAGDAGTWQFYCDPHSSGTYPNRIGMVGTLSIATPPTDNTLLIVGGIVVVVVIVAAAAVMMRRKPKAPAQPPSP